MIDTEAKVVHYTNVSTVSPDFRESLKGRTLTKHINYMKYIGKIIGEFEETQSVEANSIEEAKQKLKDNLGETIERTATGDLEVSNIVEVE